MSSSRHETGTSASESDALFVRVSSSRDVPGDEYAFRSGASLGSTEARVTVHDLTWSLARTAAANQGVDWFSLDTQEKHSRVEAFGRVHGHSYEVNEFIVEDSGCLSSVEIIRDDFLRTLSKTIAFDLIKNAALADQGERSFLGRIRFAPHNLPRVFDATIEIPTRESA